MALTAVDTLDALVLLGRRTELARTVALLQSNLTFDIDKEVGGRRSGGRSSSPMARGGSGVWGSAILRCAKMRLQRGCQGAAWA
jgi:hypothetical protein